MANYEATKYNFDGSDLTGIEGTATGTILPWSAASLPTGFLECNGQAVSRSTYSALFAVIASTYGGGDGSSTFNVPDLQDNVAVSKSNNKALASTGGANTVAVTATGNVGGSTANATLSTAQLASHNHPQSTPSGPGPWGGPGTNASGNPTTQQPGGSTFSTGQTNTGSGGGHSHNMSATFSGSAVNAAIVQPYLTLIYIIKT
jgi:microcystin-dependent protein